MFWALLFSACLAVYAVFRYGEVLTYNGRVSVEFPRAPRKNCWRWRRPPGRSSPW